MSAPMELIKNDANGKLDFGDYTLSEKSKRDDFSYDGDIYKIKTFCEITKLEKNEMFIYESVPGSTVRDFLQTETETSFLVEANEDINITLELLPESEYDVVVDGTDVGKMTTKFSGKLMLSVELEPGVAKSVNIKKVI